MTVRKEPGEDWAPDHMARWLEAVTKRLHADLGAQGGFVASGQDPADGRVRLITRTEQGDAAAIEAQRAIDAVERGWRREIGAARYDAMKQVLRQIGRDKIAD